MARIAPRTQIRIHSGTGDSGAGRASDAATHKEHDMAFKTVKQSLSRVEIADLYARLKRVGLRPQERYDPSLSGRTMGVFRLQVPEEEEAAAKSEIAKY